MKLKKLSSFLMCLTVLFVGGAAFAKSSKDKTTGDSVVAAPHSKRMRTPAAGKRDSCPDAKTESACDRQPDCMGNKKGEMVPSCVWEEGECLANQEANCQN